MQQPLQIRPSRQHTKRQLASCRGTHRITVAQEMEWSHLLGP